MPRWGSPSIWSTSESGRAFPGDGTMSEGGGMTAPLAAPSRIEWLTLWLILGCYAGWALALFGLSTVSGPLAVVALAVVIAFHSSLSHEAIHGHPFPSER